MEQCSSSRQTEDGQHARPTHDAFPATASYGLAELEQPSSTRKLLPKPNGHCSDVLNLAVVAASQTKQCYAYEWDAYHTEEPKASDREPAIKVQLKELH